MAIRYPYIFLGRYFHEVLKVVIWTSIDHLHLGIYFLCLYYLLNIFKIISTSLNKITGELKLDNLGTLLTIPVNYPSNLPINVLNYIFLYNGAH